MKKLVILCVATMLAIPAMGYAGSATSRWDLTIGGFVKVDVSYADQSSNQDVTFAERQSGPAATSSRDKYSAVSWGAGETRLNFLVKGPDTWGAKTSAFVEGDFRSMSSNAVAASARNSVEDYGLFNLRHAFMKFDWPTFTLVMGQTWTIPGVQPCFCLLDVNEIGPFNKGAIQPEIYGTWQATKTFSATLGAMAPYQVNKWPGGTLGSGPTIDDGFQRSNWPMLFTELLYKTDALGKIGPWMLQFGLGGFYAKDKPIAPASYGPVGNINSASATNTVSSASGVQYWNASGYDTSNVDMWMVTFRGYIPIIPEKAPGKLAGSLALAWSAFTGQDVRTLAGPTQFQAADYAYNRADAAGAGLVNTADYHAPVVTGGWGQVTYYFTDTVWAGFYYGQVTTNLSQWRKNQISSSAIDRQQEYIVNLIYDPNPAVRVGLEYSYYTTHYGKSQYPNLTSEGNVNMVRLAAQYFF
jgi:hypothetical protein